MSKIKVRIAPSPTGKLHIGTARTALFNYLFTKKNKGKFIIRIEDTDTKRSKREFEKDIIENLEWLGLKMDEKIIYQSKRIEIYQKYAQKLLENNKAYLCFCTPDELEKERRQQVERHQPPRYSGKCRNLSQGEIEKYKSDGTKAVIRLKIPENRGKIRFKDLIREEIQEESALIGDFIIVKSSEMPVFFFSGVIDDHLQQISHVIRGEDHISNTFAQILIYEALDWEQEMPKFAHLPLILNPDRSKMSKRKGDITTSSEFRKRGYLRESLINFMVLLGWHPRKPGKNSEEIYSLDELIPLFEIREIGKSAAIFDINKLDYINSYYIKNTEINELKKMICPKYLGAGWKCKDEVLEKAIILVKDRMKKLADFIELADYFFEEPNFDNELLIFKKSNKIYTQRGLKAVTLALEKIDDKDWEDQNKLQKALSIVVTKEKLNNGDVFWPVRVALSGREASPSPVELLWAMGKEESLKRLNNALKMLR